MVDMNRTAPDGRATIDRRTVLWGLGGIGAAATLAACSGGSAHGSGSSTEGGAATSIKHKFGETVPPASPKRIVSAGVTEHDHLLALGIAPVGVTEWYGDQPYATWPWARASLGSAKPEVLHNSDGFEFEKIAALRPDLILAINAGTKQQDYDKLKALAPTVAQGEGQPDYFEPWKLQAKAIGTAVGQSAKMDQVIAGVEEKFKTAAADNPALKGKKVIFLQNAFYDGAVIAYQQGLSTDFLTGLGLVVPPGLEKYSKDGQQAVIPKERMVEVLDAADLLIWGTEKAEDQTVLEADPVFRELDAFKRGRCIYTGGEMTAAIYFTSPLSLPFVVDGLVPKLTATLH